MAGALFVARVLLGCPLFPVDQSTHVSRRLSLGK